MAEKKTRQEIIDESQEFYDYVDMQNELATALAPKGPGSGAWDAIVQEINRQAAEDFLVDHFNGELKRAGYEELMLPILVVWGVRGLTHMMQWL